MVNNYWFEIWFLLTIVLQCSVFVKFRWKITLNSYRAHIFILQLITKCYYLILEKMSHWISNIYICFSCWNTLIEISPSSGFQVSFVFKDSSIYLGSANCFSPVNYGHCPHLFLILSKLFLICTPNQKPIFEHCHQWQTINTVTTNDRQ